MPHWKLFNKLHDKLHPHHNHKSTDQEPEKPTYTYILFKDNVELKDGKAATELFTKTLSDPKFKNSFEIGIDYSTYFNVQPVPYGISTEEALTSFKKRYIGQFELSAEKLNKILTADNLQTYWHGKMLDNPFKIAAATKLLSEKLTAVHVDVYNEKFQFWERAHAYPAQDNVPRHKWNR